MLVRLFNSKITQSILGLIVAILIVQATIKLVGDCTLLPDFRSPFFATAIVLAIVYRFVNALGWPLVLDAMGRSVNRLDATRIWLRAESQRWLPGGVWGYASRAAQAERLSVPATFASASMLVELLLTLVAAVACALPLVAYYDAFLPYSNGLAKYESLIAYGAVGCVGMGLLLVAMRRKIIGKLKALRDRFENLRGVNLQWRKVSAAILFFIVMGCMNGLVTTALTYSTPLSQYPPVLVIVGATALAWLIGFLAIFAPGGLVVREAVFAMCLAPWTDYSLAFAIAILARLIQLVAEAVGMVWAYGTQTVKSNVVTEINDDGAASSTVGL